MDDIINDFLTSYRNSKIYEIMLIIVKIDEQKLIIILLINSENTNYFLKIAIIFTLWKLVKNFSNFKYNICWKKNLIYKMKCYPF